MLDIHQSIDEILDSEDIVGGTFYRVFFTRYPDVQHYFAGVNMARQAVVLTIALLLIEQYETYRYPAIAKYLRHLGIRHRQRQIPREMYGRFRDALLEALAEHHGPRWNQQVAEQWRAAIDRAIHVMLEAYDQPETDSLPTP